MTAEDTQVIGQILAAYSPEIRALTALLRHLVAQAAPQLQEEGKLGWKNITYRDSKMVCAISPHTNWVSLHFYNGVQLADPEGVLEGSGKLLRHVKIRRPQDVRPEVLGPMIQEAARYAA